MKPKSNTHAKSIIDKDKTNKNIANESIANIKAINDIVDQDKHNVTTSTTTLLCYDQATTSTTGLLKDGKLKPGEDYLVLGQNIGAETRNVEFKRGGGQYLKTTLKDHVPKYVCSFLNSGEGGSLYIGVDDNGTVQGISVTQREEDNSRLVIDSVIRSIRPAIFPQAYTVAFIEVVQKTNDEVLPIGRKVLCVTVLPPPAKHRLYETAQGNAYIRRDGSTQGPMKSSEIMEFTSMLCAQQMKAKDDEIAKLHEIIDRLAKKDSLLEKITKGFRRDSRHSIDECSQCSRTSSKELYEVARKDSLLGRIAKSVRLTKREHGHTEGKCTEYSTKSKDSISKKSSSRKDSYEALYSRVCTIL